MVLWAIVSTVTGLVQNYIGLVLTRFFLGITEAPYYPGALYLLSIFYTRKEIATRVSILYTGNILATAFAGLIALGIFKLGGVAGISGWRWLFIIQGIVTFVVAIVGIFLLPDDPTRTWWLTPEERLLAQERMDRDTVDNKGGSSTWDGLKQAVKDKVWSQTRELNQLCWRQVEANDTLDNSEYGSSSSCNMYVISESSLPYLGCVRSWSPRGIKGQLTRHPPAPP